MLRVTDTVTSTQSRETHTSTRHATGHRHLPRHSDLHLSLLLQPISFSPHRRARTLHPRFRTLRNRLPTQRLPHGIKRQIRFDDPRRLQRIIHKATIWRCLQVLEPLPPAEAGMVLVGRVWIVAVIGHGSPLAWTKVAEERAEGGHAGCDQGEVVLYAAFFRVVSYLLMRWGRRMDLQ